MIQVVQSHQFHETISHPYQEHRSQWYHWKEDEVHVNYQIRWSVFLTSQLCPRILHLNLAFLFSRTHCMINLHWSIIHKETTK